MMKTMAEKWIIENASKILHDDACELKFPMEFSDGSRVIEHENGVAIMAVMSVSPT